MPYYDVLYYIITKRELCISALAGLLIANATNVV